MRLVFVYVLVSHRLVFLVILSLCVSLESLSSPSVTRLFHSTSTTRKDEKLQNKSKIPYDISHISPSMVQKRMTFSYPRVENDNNNNNSNNNNNNKLFHNNQNNIETKSDYSFIRDISPRNVRVHPTAVFLELSPLIGGPQFLPIHVKVAVIPQYNDTASEKCGSPNVVHKWDFLPTNAKDPETISELLQLKSVPGIIRYDSSSIPIPTTTPVNTRFEKENQLSHDHDKKQNNKAFSLTLPLVVLSIPSTSYNDDSSSIIIHRINNYCKKYPNRNLHLVWNNCWTFAIQLCFEISSWSLFQKTQ